METVKTVRNTYKSLPRPGSWAEVKSKNLILNFNLFWTGVFVNIHLLNINLEYQYPYIYILIKKIMNKIIITVICIFVFVYNISFSQNKLSAGASFGGQLPLEKNYPFLYSSSPVLNLEFQYCISNNFSTVLNAAIRKTENDVEFAYSSAGAKYTFYRCNNLFETFTQAGAGIYMGEKASNVSTMNDLDTYNSGISRGKYFGLYIGCGINCNIQRNFILDFNFTYHIFNLSSGSKAVSFINPGLGFKIGIL